MLKYRAKERRIFTSRKRMRRRSNRLWGFASVLLFLLVLELLTRLFVDISGKRGEFAQKDVSSEKIQAYQLNFVNPELEQNLDPKALKAKSSLAVGYELLSKQESQYWQINEQGFRDRDPVPLVKPKDEIRIFLLGNSTAFGYGSTDNTATISEHLEKRLQERLQQQIASPNLYKPDVLPFDKVEKRKYQAKPSKIRQGKYRVINASVPGYASGNELARLALEVLKYKPDLVVALDGYEDLMLPSNKDAVQALQVNKTPDKPSSFVSYLSQSIEPIENKSYLAKIAQKRWLNNRQKTIQSDFLLNEQTSDLVRHLPPNQEELQLRIDRYLDHQKQILNLSAAAQIPLVVAMQPEITGRNPSQLTDTEGEIATELGRTYIKKMRNSYPVLIQATQQLARAFPQNMKVIDLYKLTEQYPSPSFLDPIHLNEAANQKVAEQLYYAISSLPKMQLVPKQAPPPKSIYPKAYKRY